MTLLNFTNLHQNSLGFDLNTTFSVHLTDSIVARSRSISAFVSPAAPVRTKSNNSCAQYGDVFVRFLLDDALVQMEHEFIFGRLFNLFGEQNGGAKGQGDHGGKQGVKRFHGFVLSC